VQTISNVEVPKPRLYNIFQTYNQVAEDEIGGPCSTNGGEEERV
jgi:hypothetical protein